MGKPRGPKPPDPIQTANAQAQANTEAVRESAKVNAIDQITPFGSVTFTRDENGIPTQQVTSLSPNQQNILDQQAQLSDILNRAALEQSKYIPTSQFTLDGMSPVPTQEDFIQQGNTVRDSMFNQAKGLLDPVFQDRSRALENNIAQRGIPITGENAGILLDREAEHQNQALQQAAFQAVQAGGAEQNRLFNLSQTARNQQISDALLQRQQPFNELSAFLQGAPVFQAPQAQPLPFQQIAPADVQGQINNNYQIQSSARNAQLGGMYGLVGTVAGAAIPGLF